MVITKIALIESVVTERTIDDYLQVGGLPKSDARQMDAEFYGDTTMDVWIDVQNIINSIIKGDPKRRNQWAFESDLNANQMRWLEHYPGSLTVAKVKARFSDEQVYGMIKSYKLNTPEELQNLASWLLGEVIPKV